MTKEDGLAADRRVFAPSRQTSYKFGLIWWIFTYICSVMWRWSYERFLKVRQRPVLCVISFQNIGRQRWHRGRIQSIIRTRRDRRHSRHCLPCTQRSKIFYISRRSPPPLRADWCSAAISAPRWLDAYFPPILHGEQPPPFTYSKCTCYACADSVKPVGSGCAAAYYCAQKWLMLHSFCCRYCPFV